MKRFGMLIAAMALCFFGSGWFVFSAEPARKGAEEHMDVVRYAKFGAVGDGVTDDLEAIVRAHEFANQHGLPVKADAGATYYIGGKNQTAVIQTDTDWGTAKFIIDDTAVLNRNANIFNVQSSLKPFTLAGISSLKRNQSKIAASLPGPCVISVWNDRIKHFIRFGLNQNNGSPQTDTFIADQAGRVDANTPIIWDFDQITKITAQPMDQKRLIITGGRFTTKANAAESKSTYYSRGIGVRRSNVVVEGVEHLITGEGDHGAPYNGFINISACANVTVRNCILTGHKTFIKKIGAAGKPVSMGTYDITANSALNISFINCKEGNDIKDRTRWGIFASNFSKNLLLDQCTFSRFDAHQGVANATIRNSTLGHAGINAIGFGTLLVENCTLYGGSLINLRSDYGSTWQGDFIIKNCVYVPACGSPATAALIGGSYSGQHDFGYTCYMPRQITIDTLRIDDTNHPANYRGPAIFADFNAKCTDASYQEKFPNKKTEQVILKNVTTASGKPLRLSDNSFMFKDVKVIQ